MRERECVKKGKPGSSAGRRRRATWARRAAGERGTLSTRSKVQAYSIYTRTLERYTTLVMAKAYKIRTIIHTRERSGTPHPQGLLNRTNHTIGPLFSLDAAGTLSMSERMAKRLDIAQIGHVGKNICILTTDEQ
eukprot:scaffold7202_cov110-Isochrysis_galbana.AAC.10